MGDFIGISGSDVGKRVEILPVEDEGEVIGLVSEDGLIVLDTPEFEALRNEEAE